MGYGDSIMVTGIAKIAKAKYPDYQIIVGDRKNLLSYYDPAIFINNPNITVESDIDLSKKTIWIEEYQGKRSYVKNADKDKFYWNDQYRAIQGGLYFSNKEMDFAKSMFNKITFPLNNFNLTSPLTLLFLSSTIAWICFLLSLNQKPL